MNSHYTYLVIDILSIIFPFAFSFEKKIAFYKQWKYILAGMIPTATVFIAWDVWFTGSGIWAFNKAYVTGYYIGNLPIEEWLFFICIPYSCTFIYECTLYYMALRTKKDKGWMILLLTGIVVLLAGFMNSYKAYTFVTFSLCGYMLILLYVFRRKFPSFHAGGFIIAYLISLVPFFIVNGFLTALPVVTYNDMENLGIRIYTIPFEDCFYGLLLLLGNVAGMEWARGRRLNTSSPNSATVVNQP